MKYLYIVDYWVPFPASEYGGLINLIAENDTEAFEILAEEESLNSYTDQYNSLLMEKVIQAQKFELVNDYESGVLEAFTT